jgi:hypothetical protein
MRTLSAILMGVLALAGCQTPEGETAASRPAPAKRHRASAATVEAATKLPENFGKPLGSGKPGVVRVPAGMLMVSEIARPRAELRTGPGIQFELADSILTQGTRVIQFMKVGVWAKVIVIGTWQSGWVHGQTLAEAKPNTRAITIDTNRLPTVLALHPVGSVASFPDQAKLAVDIPKGAMFRSLRFADNDALIYLPDTNSVMWMSRKDVQ